MSGKKLIQVLGPTAVGKTDYAIQLALKYSSPVISCDSRQIFKEMRIGTAPPSEEQLRQVAAAAGAALLHLQSLGIGLLLSRSL